jgi:hypothetical protein
MLKRSKALHSAFASLALSALPVSAATFDVTEALWGDTSTTNSLAWAIHQANTTPGADVIRLFSDVNVDQAIPVEIVSGFLTELTDTAGLRIQGNGHSLVGNPAFIDSNGNIIDKNFPRRYAPIGGDMLLIEALSFARVADNVKDVTIDGLVVDGLNAFLDIGEGSVVNIFDSTIKNAVGFGHTSRPSILAQSESTVNMTEVTMHKLNPFGQLSLGTEFFWTIPAIYGSNAKLNLYKSTLDLYSTSSTNGAVSWAGGTANIVSSLILGQGLSVSDLIEQGVLKRGFLNVVNSVLKPAGDAATARIQAWAGGVANLIASTLQFDALNVNIPNSQFCPNYYPCNGAPLQAFYSGEIHLQSSAVSVLNESLAGIQYPYSDMYDIQTGAPAAGILTADQFSYVQPVTNQDAASLKLLFQQPNLLTAGVAYALDPNSNPPFLTYYDLPAGASPTASGPLVGVIPDADSINQLTNPIDNSVISTDVFGNPRTANGLRDVGAVQTPGPLPLLGCGAAFGWSRRLRRRVKQKPPIH